MGTGCSCLKNNSNDEQQMNIENEVMNKHFSPISSFDSNIKTPNLNIANIISLQSLIRGFIARKQAKSSKSRILTINQIISDLPNNTICCSDDQFPNYSNPAAMATELKHGPFEYPSSTDFIKTTPRKPVFLENGGIYIGE